VEPSPAPVPLTSGQSVTAVAFTMAEHDELVRFRRKLRRKAVWVLVNAEHPECPESVEVYLPYQVPGQAAPLLILWRSEAGVWLVDKDIGPVEGPAPLGEALEIVEAILKTEMLKAIRAIPVATCPRFNPPTLGAKITRPHN
jgi:hypothetical protein